MDKSDEKAVRRLPLKISVPKVCKYQNRLFTNLTKSFKNTSAGVQFIEFANVGCKLTKNELPYMYLS